MPRSLSVGVAVAVLLALALPAQGAQPPEVTLVLCDGTVLKGVTLPTAVQVVTRYGRLVVPSNDIRRIEVGLRLGGLLWLGAWEQDTVITADCVLTGRLEAKALKVHSRVLRRVSVRVADLLLVCGAGGRTMSPASDVATQLIGIRETVQLTQLGLPDSALINRVRKAGIVYNLTADQINHLKQNNVGDAVIREMQATAGRGPGGNRTAGAVLGRAEGVVPGAVIRDRVVSEPPVPSAPGSTPPLPTVR